MPKDITYYDAIEFSLRLDRINVNKFKDRVIINIHHFCMNRGKVEPFASLIIINSIRAFSEKARNKGIDVKFKLPKESLIRNTYARSIRFYSSLGLPIGAPPDHDYRGDSPTFIPIMKVNIAALKNSVDEHRDIKYIAEHVAVTAASKNKELLHYLNYCLIEILRNVDEHSESKYIWYAAHWHSEKGRNSIEIALMDEGIGIQESLKHELEDEDEKLKFALIPGCSSRPSIHYIGDNAQNAGFGLYMTSEIGKVNGDFIIASNDESLMIKQDVQDTKSCAIRGTIIRLRLEIDKLKDYEMQRAELVEKGLERAKQYLAYAEKKKFAPGLPLQKLF